MPLPEKEYFALEEIERRWGTERVDTIYYAENGLLEIAVRVVGVGIGKGAVVRQGSPEGHGAGFRVMRSRPPRCAAFARGAAWAESTSRRARRGGGGERVNG